MPKLIEGVDYEVVWSGRDPLIEDRATRHDDRIDLIPSFDLDEGEHEDTKAKRKYTRTGRHHGEFTRKPKDDRTTVSGDDGCSGADQ